MFPKKIFRTKSQFELKIIFRSKSQFDLKKFFDQKIFPKKIFWTKSQFELKIIFGSKSQFDLKKFFDRKMFSKKIFGTKSQFELKIIFRPKSQFDLKKFFDKKMFPKKVFGQNLSLSWQSFSDQNPSLTILDGVEVKSRLVNFGSNFKIKISVVRTTNAWQNMYLNDLEKLWWPIIHGHVFGSMKLPLFRGFIVFF